MSRHPCPRFAGPVLDQLIHTFVLVDDDGAFGGVDTLRSELLSCSEWLQQVGCALPRFRLHPGLSDVLTEVRRRFRSLLCPHVSRSSVLCVQVSPLDFACLQSHYPDLLRFAKVVTEWVSVSALPVPAFSFTATLLFVGGHAHCCIVPVCNSSTTGKTLNHAPRLPLACIAHYYLNGMASPMESPSVVKPMLNWLGEMGGSDRIASPAPGRSN